MKKIFILILLTTVLSGNANAGGVSVPYMDAIHLKELLNSRNPTKKQEGAAFIMGVANALVTVTAYTCKTDIDISYSQLVSEVTSLLDLIEPNSGDLGFGPVAYILEDLTGCQMIPTKK